MKSNKQRALSFPREHAWLAYGLALAVAALTLCQRSAAADGAPQAAGIQLPVSINAVMVALTDRSAEPFWIASQKRPRSRKDWDFLQYYATDIALAGVVISFPGTGHFDAGWVQSQDWQKRAKMLTALGMQALDAAKDRDQVKMQHVSNQLVQLCNDCHMQFKPEIPSQGIIMHSEYYNPDLYGKPKR